MSTSTLIPFRVVTVAGSDRQTITVVAKSKAAAAAQAAAAHRARTGLGRNTTVLTGGIHQLARTQQAPTPITKTEQARNARLARQAQAAS